MADLGLVKQLMRQGLDRAAAAAQVEAVTTAIIAQLRADKAVTLAGVGQLKSSEVAAVAPFPPGHRRRERRATFTRRNHLVDVGEVYEDVDYVPPKRNLTFGRIR